jgi:hypothetical protein
MQTVDVLALIRFSSVGSVAASPSTLRVEPKATSVEVLRSSSLGARAKNWSSLGLEPVGAGPAALDEVHAEAVELLGDAQLVVHREGDALQLGAVAQRGVVDVDALGLVGPSRDEAP